LCEAGYIQGVSIGNYTKSVDNKKYAIIAVDILGREQPNNHYTNTTLWNQVLEELGLRQKKHNGQMDVVLALWNDCKIRDIN